MMKLFCFLLTIGLVSRMLSVAAQSPTDLIITKKGSSGKTSISLSQFKCAEKGPADVFLRTLIADLNNSGWFEIVQSGGTVFLEGDATDSSGTLRLRAKLLNAAAQKEYFSILSSESSSTSRTLAHRLSDKIVFAVKKVRGIASTRIVMIGSADSRKNIYMCDADGFNVVQITKDNAICIAPQWGPKARHLFYTSYHKGFPDVYEINLETFMRRRISAFPGLNACPDVSPDGKEMTLTLSKDGNPELYVVNLATRKATRLTRTGHAAEASPSWSPEAKQIVFVSDRSGSPQLYVISRNRGHAKRLTYTGRDNVSPDWGIDGRIVFSGRRAGRYEVCIIDPHTRKETTVPQPAGDNEDPSWAPDGRHIVCSNTQQYRSNIYILDTLGDPPLRLTRLQGDWYSPAWSPE